MNREQAIDIIRQFVPQGHADWFISYLAPSARIVVDDGHSDSYFGGLPLLPRNMAWPEWDKNDFVAGQIERLENKFKANPRATGLRDIAQRMRVDLSRGPLPLLFLGNLSLAEISASAPIPGWPAKGLLQFFVDPSTWGYDPLARGHCQILYFPVDTELVQTPYPKKYADEAKFRQHRLCFAREWTLPTNMGLESDDESKWTNDDHSELCQRLMSSLSKDEPIHRCGGHPQEIQGDMRLKCQLVTNGLYCGDESGYQDPRREVLEKGVTDWRLLLQVDSDEKRFGWMWGDSGRLYFWARKQDLKSADFTGSWSVLQCY